MIRILSSGGSQKKNLAMQGGNGIFKADVRLVWNANGSGKTGQRQSQLDGMHVCVFASSSERNAGNASLSLSSRPLHLRSLLSVIPWDRALSPRKQRSARGSLILILKALAVLFFFFNRRCSFHLFIRSLFYFFFAFISFRPLWSSASISFSSLPLQSG